VRAIGVYCGSSVGTRPVYREAAGALGRAIAGRSLALVYGGGEIGLMGVAADAALAAGGWVIGVIPEFLCRAEVDHPGLSEMIVVDSMHARKRIMVERADGIVVLPGGLGTLDEAVEVLTWCQLGLIDTPVVFLDADGFWAPFQTLIAHMVAEGFVRPEHGAMVRLVADPEAALAALEGDGHGGGRRRQSAAIC